MAVLRWTIVVLGMKNWPMAIIYRWPSYPGSFYRENDREWPDWRLYAGGALIRWPIGQVQLYLSFNPNHSRRKMCLLVNNF